jgi:hypothetical protein
MLAKQMLTKQALLIVLIAFFQKTQGKNKEEKQRNQK